MDEFTYLSGLLSALEASALSTASVVQELGRDNVLDKRAYSSMREVIRHIATIRDDIAKARAKAPVVWTERSDGHDVPFRSEE